MSRFSALNRWRLPLLLVLALVAWLLPEQQRTAPTPPSQVAVLPLPSTPDNFQQSRHAVVRIMGLEARQRGVSVGTGFFIDESGTVLTAFHVVGDMSLLEVQTLDGRLHPAKLVAYDAENDVAMLQVTGNERWPYLPLSNEVPRAGDAVMAIGNSGNDFLQPRSGQVTEVESHSDRSDFPPITLGMNAPLSQGDSGGPVLDASGAVVGVVSYIRSDRQGIFVSSHAVPTPKNGELMRRLLEGYTRDRGIVGVGVTDGQNSALVTDVRPGSPAEAAGILPQGGQEDGDEIVAIDGKKVKSADDVLRLLGEREVGETVTLRLKRSGKERSARVRLAPQREVLLSEENR